jgi:Tol biopolymer transport system component
MFLFSLVALAAPSKKSPPRVESNPPEIVFEGEGHAVSPLWSGDGRWLAVEETASSAENRLWMIELGEKPLQVVLPGAFGSERRTSVFAEKTWHPEGILVFSANRNNGKDRIFFKPTQGGAAAELILLSAATGNLRAPSVGQGGELLALTVDGDLAVRSTATTEVNVLERTPETEASPRFDPRGVNLVFERQVDGQSDIYTTDLKQERALRAGPEDQIRPVYADAEHIVYFSGTRGDWSIEVIEVGGDPRVLAKGVRLPHRAAPSVSPNGQWVAYGVTDPKKTSTLMLSKLDGSQTLELRTVWTDVGEPALVSVDGVDRVAFSAITAEGSTFRALAISEITDERVDF